MLVPHLIIHSCNHNRFQQRTQFLLGGWKPLQNFKYIQGTICYNLPECYTVVLCGGPLVRGLWPLPSREKVALHVSSENIPQGTWAGYYWVFINSINTGHNYWDKITAQKITTITWWRKVMPKQIELWERFHLTPLSLSPLLFERIWSGRGQSRPGAGKW